MSEEDKTETVAIFPDTTNAYAVFLEDGEEHSYRVICWMHRRITGTLSGELYQDDEVVGMTLLDGDVRLSEVDSGASRGTFLRYELESPTT